MSCIEGHWWKQSRLIEKKDQDATVQKTKPTQLQMIYHIPILSVIRDQHSG
jgi:hypothetical protein